MSKPEDIPQDIWEAVADTAFDLARVGMLNSSPSAVRGVVSHHQAAIARAVALERQRCATYHDDKAAEHEAFREYSRGDAIDHHAKMVRVHQRSAEAIRKGQ